MGLLVEKSLASPPTGGEVVKIWGLYSSRVDPYDRWELIELFSSEEQARLARDLLTGQLMDPNWLAVWKECPDEPEFDDLHVRALDLR